MNLNIKSTALLLLCAFAAASACAAKPVGRAQYLMGTVCEITAYGPRADEAITAAFAEIARWDRALSLYKEDSELSRFNRSAGRWFSCSPSLWEQLDLALRYSKASGGAFDPTILPVLKDGPAALPQVGYGKIQLDRAGRRARLRPGMALDFGGIAKGLALDHAAGEIRARGGVSALINFGGQLLAIGSPPGQDGWPAKISGSPLFLRLRDASLSTSGNDEHPGHIASPFSGQRIRETYTASALSPTAVEADAWSTALFVLGPRAKPAFSGCAIFTASDGSSTAGDCSRYIYPAKEPRHEDNDLAVRNPALGRAGLRATRRQDRRP